MTFSSLGLSAPILKAIAEKGYDTPSPIQAEAIPVVLAGDDVMAAAQTGTGKTAGFTLPILQKLISGQKAKANHIRVLVLTPTRELAAQVADSVETYGRHLPLTSTVVFGGVKINPQMLKLRTGADILVATPGRLLDLHSQNAIHFKQLDVLVLAKALSGGVVPIGACVYRGALLHRDFAMEHSSTFAGGSVACRAGLAALQELSDPGLLHRVSVLGAYLRQELLRLARRYPTLMQGVRGRGLMLGVVLRADPQAWAGSLLLHLGGQGGLGYLVCALLLEEGVRLAPTLSDGDVLRIEPPLTNARAEARTLVAALDRVLGWLVAKGTTEALRPLLGPPQAQRAEPTTAQPADRPPRHQTRGEESRRGHRRAHHSSAGEATALAELIPR